MGILKHGDTIGIISPSWVADKSDYEKYVKGIEGLGFRIKLGKNIIRIPINIPIVYCDDFGHGANHAIFPIGGEAFLDTGDKTLSFQ